MDDGRQPEQPTLPMQRIARLIYRALGIPQQEGRRVEAVGREQLVDAFGDLVIATIALAIITDFDPADILNAVTRGWDLGERVAKRIDARELLAETKEEGNA